MDDWQIVLEAAADAHMPVHDYCRLMVLAASGMAGVAEHIARAIDTSALIPSPDELLAAHIEAHRKAEP